MSKNSISVEIIENRNHRLTPYNTPRRNSSTSFIQETSSFDSEQTNHLESIVSNISITNMSITTNDISELLKTLPCFEPNENLPLFIAKVERILATLRTFTLTPFQDVLITQIILSKIKGQAATNIFLENTSEWSQIKTALIKYYGDHRNENLLNSNLKQTRQNQNETTLHFYHKIIEAQNALIQYAQLHLSNVEILNYEILKIKNASLEQFKVGIREPYRSLLSYVPPSNIEEALLKCHEYDNNQTAIRQLHNFPQKAPNAMPAKPNNQQQHHPRTTNEPTPFNYNTKMYNMPPPNAFNRYPPRPFGDINRPIPQRNTPPTNHQVFGPQRPSTSSQNYKPTPMSIQTSSTRPSIRQFPVQPQGRPNFISKELHNTEITQISPEQEIEYFCDESQINEQEYFDEYIPNSQEENFQTTASEPPPST